MNNKNYFLVLEIFNYMPPKIIICDDNFFYQIKGQKQTTVFIVVNPWR